ncbi:MAG: twin-arginine translocase TatA/TatE family subunit [Acidobacteriota bacterium]
MLTIGGGEMFVIILLALVMFGPKKLPELFRTVTKYYGEFRRASNDLKTTFERELHTLDQDTREIKASLERELHSFNEETKDLQITAHQTALELADHASYNYGLGEAGNLLDHETHGEQNPFILAEAEAGHEPAAITAGEHAEQPIHEFANVESHGVDTLTPVEELQMVNLPAFVPATEGTVARVTAVAHQAPLTEADEAAQTASPDPVHHG